MSGRITFIVAFLVFTSACGPVGEMAKLQSSTLQNIGLGPVSPDLPTGGGDEEDGGGDDIWEGLKICSELDFENLNWSKNVAVDDRDWFALPAAAADRILAEWDQLGEQTTVPGMGSAQGMLEIKKALAAR